MKQATHTIKACKNKGMINRSEKRSPFFIPDDILIGSEKV